VRGDLLRAPLQLQLGLHDGAQPRVAGQASVALAASPLPGAGVGQVTVVDVVVVRAQVRRSSRLTVDGDRPRRRAISRTPCPRPRKVAIRWRSSSDRYRLVRAVSANRTGGIPPFSARHR